MSKWINRFLKKEFQNGTDRTDKHEEGRHLSVLSVSPQRLLGKNLENIPEIRTDITDRTDKPGNERLLSVLSVPSQGILDRNLENISATRTDITDKSNSEGLLSVLSVPPQRLLGKNLENISETRTDITDKCFFPSGLSVQSERHFKEASRDDLMKEAIFDDFEERLAITEYDGHQPSSQAQRIAYLDAFMAVLAALPWESPDQEGYENNWLDSKISAAREWLKDQGMQEPE